MMGTILGMLACIVVVTLLLSLIPLDDKPRCVICDSCIKKIRERE